MSCKTNSALAALMLALCGGGQAVAQAPPPLVGWVGLAVVDTSTSQCNSTIVSIGGVGGSWSAVYFPAGFGSNGADSTFSIKGPYTAFTARVVGGSFVDNAVVSGATLDPIGNLVRRAGRVLTFSTVPASITPTTEFITIIAKLTNVGGIQGCTVRYRAPLTLVTVPVAPPAPANSESSP